MNRRKSIRLKPHEHEHLAQLYLAAKIPLDQFAQRPRALEKLVNAWRSADPGRIYLTDDIRHYMVNARKCGKWVRFDGEHLRLKCPGVDALTPSEWDALRASYIEINVGRDNFGCDSQLRELLADKFFERTSHHIAPDLLYAAAMARQKAGEWVKVTPRPRGIGFKDIDDVA